MIFKSPSSYGQDPRRIEYAGSGINNVVIDYSSKYKESQQTIKDNYDHFEVPYYGKDNDDYVNGQGFCCDDTPQTKSFAANANDNLELYQYYYHSDHLGSSSLITNLDGEIVQHIEYVPFGEVFIEERNTRKGCRFKNKECWRKINPKWRGIKDIGLFQVLL